MVAWGIAIGLVLLWVLYRMYVIGRYEKQVRCWLINKNCPAYYEEIILDSFNEGVSAKGCAGIMKNKWKSK